MSKTHVTTHATLAQLFKAHHQLHFQKDLMDTIDDILQTFGVSGQSPMVSLTNRALDSVHDAMEPMLHEIDKVNNAKINEAKARKSFDAALDVIATPAKTAELHNQTMQELIAKDNYKQVIKEITSVKSPLLFSPKSTSVSDAELSDAELANSVFAKKSR